MFLKTVIRQGNTIFRLNKKISKLLTRNCNLIGQVDDEKEIRKSILKEIEKLLLENDYGNSQLKIRKALDFTRKQIEIVDKEMED